MLHIGHLLIHIRLRRLTLLSGPVTTKLLPLREKFIKPHLDESSMFILSFLSLWGAIMNEHYATTGKCRP